MNKQPTEIAFELAELSKKLGSARKAAKAMKMSPASASRYLRLVKLSAKEREKIDAGELPIRPSRTHKQKSVPLPVNEKQNDLLHYVAKTRFCITEQIIQYFDWSESMTRAVVDELLAKDYLSKDKTFSPHVIALSSKGCVYTNRQKPKHFVSGTAIHQYLMRNRIELSMRLKNSSVRFVERTDCWQRGLLPAVAEHVVEFEHESITHLAYILIDDYTMEPSRLLRALTRPHDKDKSYVLGDVVQTWINAADYCFVYVTNKEHLKNHQRFYLRYKTVFDKLGLHPVYRFVESIWGRS